jgi:predicted 3-demethylubiquinone-9 3-methyltransferase (glyoxalase superfamily)
MQKITPCLWFDDQAEEAVNFYTSVFGKSKITSISRYDEAASKATGRPKGSVMTVVFQLEGQDFMALNGGPVFTFTPAISLMVNCRTQEEIDNFWTKLTDGGQEVQCGWLTDKYGISWQIVPAVLGDMMSSGDSERVARVTAAFLKMKKFDIAALQRAFEGR